MTDNQKDAANLALLAVVIWCLYKSTVSVELDYGGESSDTSEEA